MTKYKARTGIALALTIMSTAANATEGVAPAGPIGGTDLNQALLPGPGFYPAIIGGGIDLSEYRLGGGGEADASGSVGFGAIGGLFVYDQKPFGGQLASSFGIGHQKSCYGIDPNNENCDEGLMDLYTDLLMWSKFSPSESFFNQQESERVIPYGTAVMLALGATWPTGNYNSKEPMNVGSNFYTFSPSIALTHTVPSIFSDAENRGTQLSARLFYNHYTENKDTEYDSGDTVSIDFSVSEIIGNWTLGITGTGWSQVIDDTVGGVSNGVRASALNVGPIVQYDFTLKDKPTFVKAKYLSTVGGEYTPQSDGLTVVIGTKF